MKNSTKKHRISSDWNLLSGTIMSSAVVSGYADYLIAKIVELNPEMKEAEEEKLRRQLYRSTSFEPNADLVELFKNQMRTDDLVK